MFSKNRNAASTIKISSEIKYVKKVSSTILTQLKPYAIDEDKVFDIRLCIEEAVRNAIVHGNHSDKKLFVRVSYWIESGDLNIEVEDEGVGFGHETIPNPTTADNIMKGSGRGVYLIKNLMDSVKFNDNGNTITMIKHLK